MTDKRQPNKGRKKNPTKHRLVRLREELEAAPDGLTARELCKKLGYKGKNPKRSLQALIRRFALSQAEHACNVRSDPDPDPMQPHRYRLEYSFEKARPYTARQLRELEARAIRQNAVAQSWLNATPHGTQDYWEARDYLDKTAELIKLLARVTERVAAEESSA